jgi:hypothetical protein
MWHHRTGSKRKCNQLFLHKTTEFPHSKKGRKQKKKINYRIRDSVCKTIIRDQYPKHIKISCKSIANHQIT